ncbi:MAG: ribonuclease III [Nitrospirota bacterium]
MTNTTISSLQENINYTFNNENLLIQAITHKSYANEKGVPDNERLEFLGDSVLNFIVSDYLIKKFPEYTEGNLSKLKAYIVNENTLYRIAEELHLGDYLLLGKGEEITGGRRKTSILADTLEALIAAIYLDGGFDAASLLVRSFISREIHDIDIKGIIYDFKTELQEYSQRIFGSLPYYKISGEYGPDHEKTFEIEVTINDEIYGRGIGKSKKEAEQSAAARALNKLRRIEGLRGKD